MKLDYYNAFVRLINSIMEYDVLICLIILLSLAFVGMSFICYLYIKFLFNAIQED